MNTRLLRPLSSFTLSPSTLSPFTLSPPTLSFHSLRPLSLRSQALRDLIEYRKMVSPEARRREQDMLRAKSQEFVLFNKYMVYNGFIRRGVTFHVFSFAALTVVRCRVCSFSHIYVYNLHRHLFSHKVYGAARSAKGPRVKVRRN